MQNKSSLLSIACLGAAVMLIGCGQTGSLSLPDKLPKSETQLQSQNPTKTQQPSTTSHL